MCLLSSVFVLYVAFVAKVNGVCDTSLSITTVTGTEAPVGEICSGSIIFEDDFNTLKFNVWRHEYTLSGGSNNNQFQIYGNNRSNTYTQNGYLHIRPTLFSDEVGEPFLSSGSVDMNSWYPHLACTNAQFNGCIRTGTTANILNPIKSARLNTVTSFAFKYGTVEARAKIPTGDWLWPAIWLMPRWNIYSGWPASGEIDLMESRGNKQLTSGGVNVGVQRVISTLHWGINGKYNKYALTNFNTNNAAGYNTDFHLYKLVWTPDNITFYVDNVQTGFVSPNAGGFWEMGGFNTTTFNNPWKYGSKMAPFDSEFFLIINLAVGSTSFFSDTYTNSPYAKPWSNTDGPAALTNFWNAKNNWLPTWNMTTDDSHLQVDYIKVYAL